MPYLHPRRPTDKFIGQAMRYAKIKCLMEGKYFEERIGPRGVPYNHCMVSEYFHKEMNRLTEEAGLRVL